MVSHDYNFHSFVPISYGETHFLPSDSQSDSSDLVSTDAQTAPFASTGSI